MNGLGLQDRKRRDLEKPFPGCFGGGMMNIFELSTGHARTKLLTDKSHRDGSPPRRNRHDAVNKPIDPVGIHISDRPMTTDVRKSFSSKKSGGTPIKMLIAQEMSKETEPKQKQHSIVARLMGLDDAVPVQQPVLTSQRNLQEGYARSKSAGTLRGRKPQEDVCFDRPRSREIHSCSHEKEYKDVYAVQQQSSGTNRARDHAPLKERGNDNQNKNRMALVREKFMEANCLATDEKLLQSKKFEDAFEVLSSNKDLFLKFLEEPNSLFLKHIKELHTIPPAPQTKCIAVLKPSKTFEPKSEKHVKKQEHPPSGGSERDIDKPHIVSTFSHPKARNLSQTTRIVVLKPSPAKISDKKAIVTTPISSPELPKHGNFYKSFETGETMGLEEIAKETTRQMRESLTGHWGDESLLSSVLSNGYVGDESSFDKSENESMGEDAGNLSDTEITTPTSRNSWDYNNRTGSPYSLSSISRKSYSPDSSMVREAKKRLSERWALVASNNTVQQVHIQRGSSTLGEMLAMPEVKNGEEVSNGVPAVSSNKSGGEELRTPEACLSIGRTTDVDGESSPRTLSRSKSVPVASSSYENSGLNIEASSYQISKSLVSKEAGRSKGGRSSFKGKVSSFFFRNKKPNKQITVPSPLVSIDGRFQTDISDSVLKNSNGLTEPVHNSNPEESLLVNFEEQSSKTSSPSSGNVGLRKGAMSSQVAISIEKPGTPENLSKNQTILGTSNNYSENQYQPSPMSVLDGPFEDDVHSSISPSSEIVNIGHPQGLSRSEPIESVAHSLSWDDLHLETSSSNPLKLGKEEQEQERFVFVRDLLSSAGLDNERVNTVFNLWHSPESPLDPMLLFKILDRKAEGAEARARRSNQRLLFDCVNVALLDIGHTTLLNAYPLAITNGESQRDALVDEEVWGFVRILFSSECQISPETDNSMVVDRLLWKDVDGRRWHELTQMELDEVCEEIGGKLLEELVKEVLLDFTGECL